MLNEADEEINSDEDPTPQNLNNEVEEILNLSAISNSKGQDNAFSRGQLNASSKRLETIKNTIKFENKSYNYEMKDMMRAKSNMFLNFQI
jgi:hypothetical protein